MQMKSKVQKRKLRSDRGIIFLKSLDETVSSGQIVLYDNGVAVFIGRRGSFLTKKCGRGLSFYQDLRCGPAPFRSLCLVRETPVLHRLCKHPACSVTTIECQSACPTQVSGGNRNNEAAGGPANKTNPPVFFVKKDCTST